MKKYIRKNNTLSLLKSQKSMFQFRKKYFAYTILLFLLELFIAMFVQDKFIRPYLGDFLVVILIYCFLRTFLTVTKFKIALGTLIFAYMVEVSQYFKLIEILGREDNRVARMVLGNAFSWEDMIMYTLGVVLVWWWDIKT